ncbi:MAG: DUF86 domain-containing protein [Bacillota bacterium]|nr:DUF86 domain-containing protein [Bacillota bacterium]MDP4172006.1 DUF86 domain-containing protein [Bacillota bacterium]
MYFVDREKIEETLVYFEQLLSLFIQQHSWETLMDKLALERLCQMMVESVLDVGNAMIDGFIMRDPGSYEDIVDILMDEKVVTTDVGAGLKQLVLNRKMLVQNYTEIDHLKLYNEFASQIQLLGTFPNSVRTYLVNELGPVSAFKK